MLELWPLGIVFVCVAGIFAFFLYVRGNLYDLRTKEEKRDKVKKLVA